MVCPSCSAINPDNLRFCGHCGKGLHALPDDAQTVMLDAETMASPAHPRSPQAATNVISPPPVSMNAVTWGMPVGPMAPASLQSGSNFSSRYRIDALLGEGGMGAVYRAYDLELDRTVALKLVRPELSSHPETMQRFKQELLLASRISHKNILRIHDLGDANGIKFITMAFVEGHDLSALVEKEGQLDYARALKFTRQLCSALEAAHHEGVVHRDLKPQNILIDQSDNLYISDFGLAKSLEAQSAMMTRTGQILGTPRYMSPEQVEAKELDHRSDLYSLGLIVYEMFTAELPFRGESAMQLMYQRVVTPAKDPREFRPDLPEYLARVILKCLEKDPAQRYQHAREILNDLDALAAPPPSAAVGAQTISIQLPKPTRRGWMMAGAWLVMAIGLVFAIPTTRHWVLRTHSGATAGLPQHHLAVLPLGLLGDESLKYMADGIGDAISAKLSGLKDVYVSPENAVSAAMSQQSDAKIAHALGVTLLVKGTVQTSGGRIAITVTMDDVVKSRQLLNKQFEGDRGDLLGLEDRVFSDLVNALVIRQTNEERVRTTSRPTENIEAYDLYLKGRNLLRGPQNVKNAQEALALFDTASQKDPSFALALAGSADACVRLYEQTKDSRWTTQALGAAQTAESLNPNLPEVHFALGSIFTVTGRTAEAIVELNQALQLAPNSDEGLRRLGTAYMKNGRQTEALATLEKATKVNPYLWTNFNLLGTAQFKVGQNEQALESFRRVSELQPDSPTGWANAGAAYYRLGKYNETLQNFQKAIDIEPKAFYYSQMGVAYFFLGHYNDSAKMFGIAVQKNPNQAGYRMNLADALRWARQPDRASATYDQAIALAFTAIEVNPKDTDALGILAICYAKKKDDAHALQYIRQARQLDSKDNDLMYKEATIHALGGRTSDALASLTEAIRNGYSLDEAKSDPELKDLRRSPEFDKLSKHTN